MKEISITTDIAIGLLEKSIKRAKENPKYYMDFIKLHKLMYLAHCYCSFVWNLNVVTEQIIARDDGPYIVDVLNLIPAKLGFEEIKNLNKLEDRINLPIPCLRRDVIDMILDIFGKFNTDEIVNIAKNTMAYELSYSKNRENEISRDLMIMTGYQISKLKDNEELLKEQLTSTERMNLIIKILNENTNINRCLNIEKINPETKKKVLNRMHTYE